MQPIPVKRAAASQLLIAPHINNISAHNNISHLLLLVYYY